MKIYSKILFITGFYATSLFCDTIQHGKEHDFMIIASPSSGSTFFFKAIRNSLDYFNPKNELFNRFFIKTSLDDFYHTHPCNFYHPNDPKENTYHSKYITYPLPNNYLEYVYQREWVINDYNITKEVFVTFFIPFLQEKFTLIALYRHRKYTFPATENKEKMFQSLYRNFLETYYPKNQLFAQLQIFLKQFNLQPIEENCGGHIIYNYILLKSCSQYSIPVVVYEKLLTLKNESLADYLKEKIPPFFYSEDLPSTIEKKRKQENNFLQNKLKKYQDLKTEPFCQELIQFMKQLDPDMPYWYLLE